MNAVQALILVFLSCGLLLSGQDYELVYPTWFNPPEIPADNQLTKKRVELGRKLFFDTMLSLDSTRSCGSCHIPALAFTDGQKVSEGIKGRMVTRNSPSLANVAYKDNFMRDGGVPTLEMQVEAPIQEHNELNLSLHLVAARMKRNPEYLRLSKEAYDREPDPFVVTRAIAAFERTLISGWSPFDIHMNTEKKVLTQDQLKGFDVFKKKGCENCHSGFLFTDQSFANTGLYLHYPDSGRMRITHRQEDRALFRVPSLRNAALTAPYMHDGSLATLSRVIEHYRTGGKAHVNKSPMIGPLEISDEEEELLIAFLKSLTDLQFTTNPAHHSPH